MASRLTKYMTKNMYLKPPTQKGFLPYISGCVEHTQALSEILLDARRRKKNIVVCWLDLANAYGSISHNLVQFAAEWYHIPETIREIIYLYYDNLSVSVSLENWTSPPIQYERGLFQGCPLSVVLFLMVFQLALDALEIHSSAGYRLNGTLTSNQRAYADDLTLIAKDPKSAEDMLHTFERFLSWSVTMKAKPAKCRSLAFGKTPETSTMSPFDPELTIHGEQIPFIHKEPMKFLGQYIYKDLSDQEVRKQVSNKLVQMLQKTDRDPVPNTGKLWIYEHLILAKVSWEFTVYCFPLSFVKALSTQVLKFLKKWAGLAHCANTSVLFRSREKGGLALTPLTSNVKCVQLAKYHQLKYSIDSKTQLIYGHIANRMGLAKNWNGVKELQDKERHLVLNEICRGQIGRSGLGLQKRKMINKMSTKEHRQELTKLVKKSEEESLLIHVYGMAKQGRALIWDTVMFLDTRWCKLIYSLSDKLLSFYLNSLSDTLPTPANLTMWKKTKLGTCTLCQYNYCTLAHILNNCRTSLTSGRYNWRHDMVLRKIVLHVQPYLEVKDSSRKTTSRKTSQFQTAEGKKYKGPAYDLTTSQERLPTSSDWQIMWDEDHHQYTFPAHIANTSARPDMVIWSDHLKTCITAELTVCWEENFQSAHERKASKQAYISLMTEGETNGWKMKYLPIEVGSRGVTSGSLSHFFRYLGLTRKKSNHAVHDVGQIALRASYTLWLSRHSREFSNWQLVDRPSSKPVKCTIDSREQHARLPSETGTWQRESETNGT